MPANTPTHQAYWNQLFVLKEQLGFLSLAVRALAMQVIATQPEQDKIVVAGQVRRRFKNSAEKRDYIDEHSCEGTWGDEDILCSVAEALGYQPTFYLHDTEVQPYQPFQQSQATGLTLHAINFGAASEGNHWELKGQRAPGDGNCMYHMLAQQIEKDQPKMMQTVAPAQPVRKAPLINQFRIKKTGDHVYDEAAQLLVKFDTAQLIHAYHYALTFADGDTYLANRPKYVTKEKGNDFIEIAIKTGKYDSNREYEVREELVHMLAKEAWRNPEADHALRAYVASQPDLAASCRQEAEVAEEPRHSRLVF